MCSGVSGLKKMHLTYGRLSVSGNHYLKIINIKDSNMSNDYFEEQFIEETFQEEIMGKNTSRFS